MKDILYHKIVNRLQGKLSDEDFKEIDIILRDVLIDEYLIGNFRTMKQLDAAFQFVYGCSVIKTGAKKSQKRGEEGAASMLFCYITRKAGYKLVDIARFMNMQHATIIYLHKQYIDRIYIGDNLTTHVYDKWNHFLKTNSKQIAA